MSEQTAATAAQWMMVEHGPPEPRRARGGGAALRRDHDAGRGTQPRRDLHRLPLQRRLPLRAPRSHRGACPGARPPHPALVLRRLQAAERATGRSEAAHGSPMALPVSAAQRVQDEDGGYATERVENANFTDEERADLARAQAELAAGDFVPQEASLRLALEGLREIVAPAVTSDPDAARVVAFLDTAMTAAAAHIHDHRGCKRCS